MSFRLSESKLRQIIREEIMESYVGEFNSYEMTPEEVRIQQKLMGSPQGEKLLNDLAKAVRAQLGPAAKNPVAVGKLLDREASKVEAEALREGDGVSGPARDYLRQQRAYALGDRKLGLSNAATAVAIGGIGSLLLSMADFSGAPFEDVLQCLKHLVPFMFAGVAATEIGDAIKATGRANDYTRILKGRAKPAPVPGKLEVPKIKF
jgi:hypothetical protein